VEAVFATSAAEVAAFPAFAAAFAELVAVPAELIATFDAPVAA
jgi:hypothetical protein